MASVRLRHVPDSSEDDSQSTDLLLELVVVSFQSASLPVVAIWVVLAGDMIYRGASGASRGNSIALANVSSAMHFSKTRQPVVLLPKVMLNRVPAYLALPLPARKTSGAYDFSLLNF